MAAPTEFAGTTPAPPAKPAKAAKPERAAKRPSRPSRRSRGPKSAEVDAPAPGPAGAGQGDQGGQGHRDSGAAEYLSAVAAPDTPKVAAPIPEAVPELLVAPAPGSATGRRPNARVATTSPATSPARRRTAWHADPAPWPIPADDPHPSPAVDAPEPTATAAPPAAAPPAVKPPARSKTRKATAAPAEAAAPAPTRTRRPARRQNPIEDVGDDAGPGPAEPFAPADLSELWADPDPEPTPAAMGWSEIPWDDDNEPVPASRRTRSRLAALRARHSRPWGPEDLEERLQASDQIVNIALATGDEDLLIEGYSWRIVDRMEMGRLSQADEDIAAFAALARSTGDPLYRRDAAAYSTMRAMLEGRFDDARLAMLDVRALTERSGDTRQTQGDRDQRYWMALEWGSDETVADVESSLKALPLGRAWAATVALLLARTRRYDDAAEWLGSISEHVLTTRPFDGEWMQMAACALEAGALVKDSRIAPVLGPLLQPYADRVVVLSDGLVCLGSTARFAGLAAATCGDWELAERNFDTATTVNQKLEAYPALAHAQAEWGWALLAQGKRGDRNRAESLLTQARDLADELDMRRLAADIRVRRGGR